MRNIKVGDRGTIDYPGTYLDKQPCRVERLNGGELYLVGSFGTTWLWHLRFVSDDEDKEKHREES